MLLTEDEIVRHRVLEDEPAAVAIFGDVREPRVGAARARRASVMSCCVPTEVDDADGARRRRAKSGDGFDQLGLSVALDAGDAEDLAARDR